MNGYQNPDYKTWREWAEAAGVLGQFSAEQLALADADDDYGWATTSNKVGYANSSTPEERAQYHQTQVELNRSKGFTGGTDGSLVDYQPTQMAQNAARTALGEDSPYLAAINSAMGTQADWSNGSRAQQVEGLRQQHANYGQGELPQAVRRQLTALGNYGPFTYDREPDYQAALDRVINPGAFSYDYRQDPAYQAYAKQYTREGRRSSEDTMGQYAAMTGGRPSTAAVTAGQQAGNYYASQLADKIPDLYNQAYQRYLNEYSRQLQGLNALQTDRATRYGEYGDTYNRMSNYLAQLQSQDATEYARLVNQLTDLENADKTEYQRVLDTISLNQGMDNTDYSRRLNAYNLAKQENDESMARIANEEQTARDRRLEDEDRQIAAEARDYERQSAEADTEWSRMLDTWKMQNTDRANEMDEAEWLAGYGRYDKLAELLGMSEEEVRAKYEAPTVSGYSGGWSSGSSGSAQSAFEQLAEAGVDSEGEAYNELLRLGYNTTQAGKLAAYYAESLGSSGGQSAEQYLALMREAGVKDSNEAFYWLMENAGMNVNDAAKAAGYYTATAAEAGGTQNAQYDQIVSSLNKMVDRDANWTEIQAEINAEERDGNISHEEAQALKAAYRDKVDNVPNSGEKHKNGRPMSKGYMDVLKRVEGQRKQRYALGTSAAAANQNALTALLDAYDRGEIHEYEIEIIRETLGI